MPRVREIKGEESELVEALRVFCCQGLEDKLVGNKMILAPNLLVEEEKVSRDVEAVAVLDALPKCLARDILKLIVETYSDTVV